MAISEPETATGWHFFWSKRLSICILLLAVLLRFFVLFTEGDQMFLGTDDDNYRESAEILLQTGTLTYAGWPGPTVFIMPGYPLILAGIFALFGSGNLMAVRVIQVLISVLIVLLSMKLGEKLGGREVGWTTGLLIALYPPGLTAPSFILTEVLFTFFLLGCLLFFLKSVETNRAVYFVITGIMLGLTAYLRPTIGLLPLVFGIYQFWCKAAWKRVLYSTMVIGLTFTLVLTPWIIRNYLIFNEFIPFTVSGGNPLLRGTYINDQISEKFPWVKGDRILSDRAQMKLGQERLISGFRHNLKSYLYWYTIGKFADFWGFPYYYISLTYLSRTSVSQLHDFLLVTGGFGALLSFWRRQRIAWLLVMVCSYITVLHLIYLAGPRYAFPFMHLLIIFSAYGQVGFVTWLDRLRA